MRRAPLSSSKIVFFVFFSSVCGHPSWVALHPHSIRTLKELLRARCTLEFFVENRCCNIGDGLVDKRPKRSHRGSVSWQPQVYLFLCLARNPVLLGSRRSMKRLIFLLRHPQPVEQDGQLPGYGNQGPFAGVLAASFGQV